MRRKIFQLKALSVENKCFTLHRQSGRDTADGRKGDPTNCPKSLTTKHLNTMKTQHNIYLGLEIVAMAIGAIIILASLIPGVMAVAYNVAFNFDVADLFLLGFFVGAVVMIGGAMLCEYLDEKHN